MNDFDRDDQWQRRVRDTILLPLFYGRFALDGRYVTLEKDRISSLIQKRCAADTVLQARDGSTVWIEEKIVRWPGYLYRAYSLETDSCTRPGYESDGWMRYGKATFLLWCRATPASLLWDLIDFQRLRAWFDPLERTFPTFGPLNTRNASAGRKVPINDVKANVPCWSGEIHPNPDDPAHVALFPGLAREAA